MFANDYQLERHDDRYVMFCLGDLGLVEEHPGAMTARRAKLISKIKREAM